MPQILVLDDSRYSRRVIGDTLRNAGYDVIEAEDGERGLAIAGEARPDCVLVDLLLPGVNGQAFLRQVQRLGYPTPVIVTTADPQPAIRHDCETLGAFDILSKPIEPDALIDAVEKAIFALE